MKRLLTPLLAGFALLAVFASSTLAQGAASSPENASILDLLRPVYDAFAHGQYVYAGALAIIAAVALARRYGSKAFPWLSTGIAGAALTVLAAFAAAIAAKLAGGVAVTWSIVKQALSVAVMAGGIFSLLKPLAETLAARVPGLKAIVDLIFNPGASEIAQAEKSGDAAVADKPAGGIDGVIGKPTDVE